MECEDLDSFDCTKHCTAFITKDSVHQNRRLSKLVHLAYSLQYCLSDKCSYPMHIIVTDLIASQSGSSKLIEVLTKVGVTVSLSTHARFMKAVTKKEEKKSGPTSYLKDNIKTALLIDNVDKLSLHARVRAGTSTKSRCWNGTSVSLMQPMRGPILILKVVHVKKI